MQPVRQRLKEPDSIFFHMRANDLEVRTERNQVTRCHKQFQKTESGAETIRKLGRRELTVPKQSWLRQCAEQSN